LVHLRLAALYCHPDASEAQRKDLECSPTAILLSLSHLPAILDDVSDAMWPTQTAGAL
jgi:hypothetical protein